MSASVEPVNAYERTAAESELKEAAREYVDATRVLLAGIKGGTADKLEAMRAGWERLQAAARGFALTGGGPRAGVGRKGRAGDSARKSAKRAKTRG